MTSLDVQLIKSRGLPSSVLRAYGFLNRIHHHSAFRQSDEVMLELQAHAIPDAGAPYHMGKANERSAESATRATHYPARAPNSHPTTTPPSTLPTMSLAPDIVHIHGAQGSWIEGGLAYAGG